MQKSILHEIIPIVTISLSNHFILLIKVIYTKLVRTSQAAMSSWKVSIFGGLIGRSVFLQTALERHVNGHFNQSETNSTTSRKSTDSGGKLVRRNGKKLRYRRQPWSGEFPSFILLQPLISCIIRSKCIVNTKENSYIIHWENCIVQFSLKMM